MGYLLVWGCGTDRDARGMSACVAEVRLIRRPSLHNMAHHTLK